MPDDAGVITLANGTLVYPDGRVVLPPGSEEVSEAPRMIEIPTHAEAVSLVVQTRKKLADLPDVPKTMNAISVVLSYTLFGLDDAEIAVAANISEQQVGKIKMLDAYEQMHQTVMQNILHAEANDIRDMFQQNARTAVRELVRVVSSSQSEKNRLVAAADILDRGGYRPADVVEHRHKMEGGLTITYIEKDTKAVPTIDIEVDTD